VRLRKGESTGTSNDPQLRWLKKVCAVTFQTSVVFFVPSRFRLWHIFIISFLARRSRTCIRTLSPFQRWNKLGLLLKGGYKPYSRKEKIWVYPKLATGVLQSELAETFCSCQTNRNFFQKFQFFNRVVSVLFVLLSAACLTC
jgi:hypothetical protein